MIVLVLNTPNNSYGFEYINYGQQKYVNSFLQNGEVVYLYGNVWDNALMPDIHDFQNNSTPKKKNSDNTDNKNKSNNTSKSRSNDYPDPDDYESYDDFMDDWEGKIPGGIDADDYWDDW